MSTMNHRGPDDEGMYVGKDAILGHKRLSIIDLSKGKQPISNEDNTIWIVFNGEIYNFKELRTQLISRGHVFKTETDTEVIVHLYEEVKEECVSRLRGMFAFAIWDERERKLLLARDRVGIKPLYYSFDSRRIVFGSEIKSVITDQSVRRDIDEAGIDVFLTFMYMPGERTLFREVLKLEPGHLLVAQNGRVNVRQYWDLGFEKRVDGDLAAATAELVDLLGDTIRGHMISDVPVGVLLSGGVDSTALLSFVVEASEKEVETFTVGFDGRAFADERPFARLAARKFGTRHHEMTISAQEFHDFLPRYVWHMEEPVCEPPAIALYYVSRLASEHVKVLLSGEGGDEAFAGYQNYRNLMWLERAKRLGWPVTGALAGILGHVGGFGSSERAKRYSHLMRMPLEQFYFSRTWNPLSALRRLRVGPNAASGHGGGGMERSSKLIERLFRIVRNESVLNQMLYVDSKTWLPDDLLVKADKMTMANSVELRVPFLDHRVLEFAAGLPDSAKIRGLTTKHILKRAFDGRVPSEILSRPKTGFPVPYESWIRGDLKDWVFDILRDRRTIERGYFDASAIDLLLMDLESRGVGAPDVFSLLVLEIWHRQFVDATN